MAPGDELIPTPRLRDPVKQLWPRVSSNFAICWYHEIYCAPNAVTDYIKIQELHRILSTLTPINRDVILPCPQQRLIVLFLTNFLTIRQYDVRCTRYVTVAVNRRPCPWRGPQSAPIDTLETHLQSLLTLMSGCQPIACHTISTRNGFLQAARPKVVFRMTQKCNLVTRTLAIRCWYLRIAKRIYPSHRCSLRKR
jgi:hypothetical protein